MPLYTSASERDRSRTGTHLPRRGRAFRVYVTGQRTTLSNMHGA